MTHLLINLGYRQRKNDPIILWLSFNGFNQHRERLTAFTSANFHSRDGQESHEYNLPNRVWLFAIAA